jgi:hypothetical protein
MTSAVAVPTHAMSPGFMLFRYEASVFDILGFSIIFSENLCFFRQFKTGSGGWVDFFRFYGELVFGFFGVF